MDELKIDLNAPRAAKHPVVEDGLASELQRIWTDPRYTRAQERKRHDLEDKEQQKRIFKMEETVMLDQLYR